ncbi:cell wall hydrolase [Lachnospiraceae bacterium ZAX-1]
MNYAQKTVQAVVNEMKQWNRGLYILAVMALSACMIYAIPFFLIQVEAKAEVHEEIDSLEKEKEKAKNQLDNLNDAKLTLESELSKLNNKLVDISTSLQVAEASLDKKEQEIVDTTAALKVAKEIEKTQYISMKKRIRFLYEMDMESIIAMLLESENFTDFINKGEYIVAIHNYDRDMLLKYKEIKEGVIQKETQLEQEEAQLLVILEELEDKKIQADQLVKEAKNEIANADHKIAATKSDIEAYEANIKKQKAYEAELERQKAVEDAKKLEEIRKHEKELAQEKAKENAKKPEKDTAPKKDTTPAASDKVESDLALLSTIIYCEAAGESYEGKLAVGSVVMNRVQSPYYPNSIIGVIYQSGQFSPVTSGRFATELARGVGGDSAKAATEVLSGKVTINSLYFRKNNGDIEGTVIGNHVFY